FSRVGKGLIYEMSSSRGASVKRNKIQIRKRTHTRTGPGVIAIKKANETPYFLSLRLDQMQPLPFCYAPESCYFSSNNLPGWSLRPGVSSFEPWTSQQTLINLMGSERASGRC